MGCLVRYNDDMRVWLCFEAHHEDGRVWAVRYGNRWHRTKAVHSMIPWFTHYRGPQASQPRAYLVGDATQVVKNNDQIIIT